MTPSGGAFQDQIRAFIDNLVSRVVGFSVRSLALIAASLLLLFYGVFGVIFLVAWPALPLLGPALIVGGLL